jgi:hypothetical protein
MGWQGYDNEGCMPGDRERVARMRDRRMETDCKRRIAAAKRDLAEKVLQVIETEERCRFGEGAKGISSAVRDFFTESGVAVEQEG